MNIKKSLGLAIIKLRRSKGVSQEAFARMAGIDRCYMSNIERGKRNISIEIIERIANKLEVSISELIIEAEEYE